MKQFGAILTIWILQTVPIFEVNAQYKKLTFGQPSPFDTAVAVRIDRYRLETKKFKLADKLIDSLSWEVKSLYREVSIADSINERSDMQIYFLQKSNLRKDSIINDVNKNFKQLFEIANKKEPWYQKYAGVAVVTVVVIELTRLIFAK